MLVHKYVEQNGLAAMLVTKRSAGVTPEMNLKNLTGDKACKQGDQGQTSSAKSPKIGVSEATQKRSDVLQIISRKLCHAFEIARKYY